MRREADNAEAEQPVNKMLMANRNGGERNYTTPNDVAFQHNLEGGQKV